jgi:PAS domain-containing protein
MGAQKPLELILARNLLSSLSTPAFLVSELGALLYYNDAAGTMLGKRFEDSGRMSAEEWTGAFGPFGPDGESMPYEEIPATVALRNNRPFHGQFRIRTTEGHQEVAASAIPIVGRGGSSGAIVIFWPVTDGSEGERR